MSVIPGYQLLEFIHKGVVTIIYRGIRLLDKQPTILKVIASERPSLAEISSINQEYLIAKDLNIEGIVKPLIVENYYNRIALILENFVRIYLKKIFKNKWFDINFCKPAIKLTKNLVYLHNYKIIHKDIKPTNIIVNPLMQSLYEIQQVEAIVNAIALRPLDINHVREIIADTLYDCDRSIFLALLFNKTQGNPYMRMPHVDGYEAAKEIRVREQGLGGDGNSISIENPVVIQSKIQNQKTAIVALTANAFEEDHRLALSFGCDDFVRKPFREEEIFEKMAQYLGVRYIYEEAALLNDELTTMNDVITENSDIPNLPSSVFNLKEALTQMPAEWLAKLNAAALSAREKEIWKLLEQIQT